MKNRTYDKKIFRLMYILNQMNSCGRVRTAELAQEFAITKRTVQRDISLLLEVGFPLVMDGNEHRLVAGFSLRKLLGGGRRVQK